MLLQFLRAHVLELQVGDEDGTPFELELVRDTFTTKKPAVSVPRDSALLGAVQCCLQDVQRDVVQKNAVAVVEHQNVLSITEVVELAI